MKITFDVTRVLGSLIRLQPVQSISHLYSMLQHGSWLFILVISLTTQYFINNKIAIRLYEKLIVYDKYEYNEFVSLQLK